MHPRFSRAESLDSIDHSPNRSVTSHSVRFYNEGEEASVSKPAEDRLPLPWNANVTLSECGDVLCERQPLASPGFPSESEFYSKRVNPGSSLSTSYGEERFPTVYLHGPPSTLDTSYAAHSRFDRELAFSGIGTWAESYQAFIPRQLHKLESKHKQNLLAPSQSDKSKFEAAPPSAVAHEGHGSVLPAKSNRQSVLLASGSNIWAFPGISELQLIAIVAKRGIVAVPSPSSQTTTPSNKPQGGTPLQSGQGGRRATAKKGRGAPNGNHGRYGRKSRTNPVVENARRGGVAEGWKGFACLFSKHNPRRYLDVTIKGCTFPPIAEYKRVKEHLRRVHSAMDRCIYCGIAWNRENFEMEFASHLAHVQCVSQEEFLRKPEPMTPEQERELASDTDQTSDAQAAWVALYRRLFPEDWPLPTPDYDYFVPRCQLRITPPNEEPQNSNTDSWMLLSTSRPGLGSSSSHGALSGVSRQLTEPQNSRQSFEYSPPGGFIPHGHPLPVNSYANQPPVGINNVAQFSPSDDTGQCPSETSLSAASPPERPAPVGTSGSAFLGALDHLSTRPPEHYGARVFPNYPCADSGHLLAVPSNSSRNTRSEPPDDSGYGTSPGDDVLKQPASSTSPVAILVSDPHPESIQKQDYEGIYTPVSSLEPQNTQAAPIVFQEGGFNIHCPPPGISPAEFADLWADMNGFPLPSQASGYPDHEFFEG